MVKHKLLMYGLLSIGIQTCIIHKNYAMAPQNDLVLKNIMDDTQTVIKQNPQRSEAEIAQTIVAGLKYEITNELRRALIYKAAEKVYSHQYKAVTVYFDGRIKTYAQKLNPTLMLVRSPWHDLTLTEFLTEYATIYRSYKSRNTHPSAHVPADARLQQYLEAVSKVPFNL
jgi:hypothetical protein